MALDPKLAAGGVAVVAIGGGAGYAISNATSEKTEDQGQEGGKGELTPKTTNVDFADGTIGKKIKDAGFALTERISSECEVELKKPLPTNNSHAAYKKAIKDCAKSKNLKARAEELKLTVLDVSLLKDDATTTVSDAGWKAKWTNADRQAEIKKIDTTEGTNWDKLEKAQKKLKDKCTELETKVIDEKITEENWTNYLTLCVKEDGTESSKFTEALKKKFWTNTTSELSS